MLGIFGDIFGLGGEAMGLGAIPTADHYLDACRKVAKGGVRCVVGKRSDICFTLDQVHAFYQHTS